MFIERLPKKIKAETLIDIFQDHHGFVEVRLIADKGIAFVEFINDDLATMALHAVTEQNLLIFPSDEGNEMVAARINYGKK